MKKVLFVLIAVLAFGVSAYGVVIFFVTPSLFDTKGEIVNNSLWRIAFYTHVAGGIISLSIGWLQFWKKFRSKRIQLHRRLGIIYISVILLASMGAGYSAVFASGGFGNQLGFFCLAVAWFYTTLMAFIAIKQGRLESHKNWMTYSYAVTFAAISLRVFLPIWMVMGIPFEEAYNAVAWFCWVPNLVIAQWIINRKWVH